MITCEPLNKFQPGLLSRLLNESYQELLDKYPNLWGKEPQKWAQFDQEAFDNLDSVGKCVEVNNSTKFTQGFKSGSITQASI